MQKPCAMRFAAAVLLLLLLALGKNLPAQVSIGVDTPVVTADSVAQDSIYPVTDVDQAPGYPGGEKKLLQFLHTRLIHPAKARAAGVSGTVIVNFVVEKAGDLTQVEVAKDIGGDCGKEALRLIQMMPAWSPALRHEQPVRCRFSLPITF